MICETIFLKGTDKMKHKNRLIGALCVNILIVIFEVIALILSVADQGVGNFMFYTQDSNYLAMIVSLLFCVYVVGELRGQGRCPVWIHTLRYIAVSCLMLTFFVVIFILMPAMGEHALSMLYRGSMLYQHTLCPILAVFSFFAFEIENKLPGTAIAKAMIPTLIYAVVTIILNLCRIIEGPYFFLLVYSQPWYMSVLWCVIVLGINGFLAFMVWRLHQFFYKRNKMDAIQKCNKVSLL